jgi:hypothetical protein
MSYEPRSDATIAKWIVGGILAAVVLCFAIYFVFRLAGPQLNLYKANTEKKAAIAEARAKADAARYLAEAEVARAKGVAEANRVIAASITEEYVRWLYVDQMDQLQGQVIYIPTEGGIPILEAGTRHNADPPGD